MDKITDHKERARELMSGILDEKPNFEAIQDIVSKQVQDVENFLYDVNELRDLDKAFGVHLEARGQFYDVQRNGETDANYRQRIRTAVIEKQGIGSIENLISAVRVAEPSANYIYFEKSYPNTINIIVDVTDQTLITSDQIIRNSVYNSQAQGQEVTIQIESEGKCFRFASNPSVKEYGDTGLGNGIMSRGVK